MSQIRSSLAKFAGSMRDPDPNSLRNFAADHFRSTGMIIIDPAWIDSWGDREFIKAAATKTFQNWGKKR